jgi:hypothetical protein
MLTRSNHYKPFLLLSSYQHPNPAALSLPISCGGSSSLQVLIHLYARLVEETLCKSSGSNWISSTLDQVFGQS